MVNSMERGFMLYKVFVILLVKQKNQGALKVFSGYNKRLVIFDKIPDVLSSK